MYVLNCARKASITGRTCEHYKKRLLNTQDSDEPLPCPVIWLLDWWYFLSPNVKNIALHFPTYWIKGCKLSYGGPYNNGTYSFILKKITLWMLFEILSSIFDTKHALHLWLCSSQSIVFLRAWIPDLFCQLLISARRPEKGFCSLWTLNVFIKLLAVCGRIKGQFFLTLLCQMCPFNAGVLLFSKNHSEKWFFFSLCELE